MPFSRSAAVVFAALPWLMGCALFTTELRTTDGPTAEAIWKAKFRAASGRSPNFAERQTFEDQIDAQVQEFLAKNPEVANSVRVGNLRTFRQASVGMTRVEVTLLLGAPDGMTSDPAQMERLAGKFWPLVKPNAKEAWSYPEGWTLYFNGDTLADITRFHRAFLQE